MEVDSLEASQLCNCNQKLDLSGGGLERVSEDLPEAWPQVEELILSKNYLDREECTLDALKRLSRLRKLTIRSGNLTAVPLALTQLHQLRFVDLSDNFIYYLPPEFANLNKLQELYLDRNHLTDIPNFSLAHPQLRKLSISCNKISNAFLRSSKMIRERNTSDKEDFEDLKLHEDLSIVNLKDNALKGCVRLTNYRNITNLDLSENNIEKLDLAALSKLQSLKCYRNEISELKLNGTNLRSIFSGNNRLKVLRINPPPLILQHLDVSHNELELLPDWISECLSLETLFASNNRLRELPERLFENEGSALTTLQASFNQLITFPAVKHKCRLRELYLQSNGLSFLPTHLFLSTSSLKVLNVSKNCLKELPQFFSKNYKLERLYLTSNALTDITALLNCVNIRTLHAAYNAISYLPHGYDTVWHDLEELVLSGNSLSSFSANVANWPHLRVLRLHSNMLSSCPILANNKSLKIADLSYNLLSRVDIENIAPPQLEYLDLSGNTKLHVDSKQIRKYKSRRNLNLVDVTGQNRNSLPDSPQLNCYEETNEPWYLGFSETVGQREGLYISQLRLNKFCDSEALLGIFEVNNQTEVASLFSEIIPRVLLEERTVKETADEYIKYTLLSSCRELKVHSHRRDVYGTLCHICRLKVPGHPNAHRYVLRIGSLGDAKTILCRSTGSLTLSQSIDKAMKDKTLNASRNGANFDPRVTEISLHEQDRFIIMANKSFWDVVSVEEAVAEVHSIVGPTLASKRLQDLAQSYGCEDNLSIMVLRFHDLNPHQDMLMKELRLTMQSNSAKVKKRPVDIGLLPRVNGLTNQSGRSSPSGQSDKRSVSPKICAGKFTAKPAAVDDSSYRLSKVDAKLKYNSRYGQFDEPARSYIVPGIDPYTNANFPDGEDTSSEHSGLQVSSEERFRGWEYMLEHNTQMLFNKELNTLSKAFTRRSSAPSRPPLLSSSRSKSVSYLPELSAPIVPFLTKKFGSVRSCHLPSKLGFSRRTVNNVNVCGPYIAGSGPNAAYFGVRPRAFSNEYDLSEIKEMFDSNLDSLETDGRMRKYWDVATTEL